MCQYLLAVTPVGESVSQWLIVTDVILWHLRALRDCFQNCFLKRDKSNILRKSQIHYVLVRNIIPFFGASIHSLLKYQICWQRIKIQNKNLRNTKKIHFVPHEKYHSPFYSLSVEISNLLTKDRFQSIHSLSHSSNIMSGENGN